MIDLHTKKIICVHFDNGKKHDYRLFKESRLPILKSTEIQADSGYQGIQKSIVAVKFRIKSKRNLLLPSNKKEKIVNCLLQECPWKM